MLASSMRLNPWCIAEDAEVARGNLPKMRHRTGKARWSETAVRAEHDSIKDGRP